MTRIWEEDIQRYTAQNWDAHIKALQDCVNLTNEVFKRGGLLETQFHKPYRRGQHTMAMDVARAFQDGIHLAAEAGTGTGKTLAYGVPAAILGVLHPGIPEAKEFRGRDKDPEEDEFTMRPLQTVISVHTLSLQDQLENDFNLISDITFAATNQRPTTLRVSGRENYFCEVSTRRLALEADEPPIKKLAAHLLQEFETLKAEGKIRSGITSELPSWPSVAHEFRRLFTANELNCALHKGKEFCNYDRAKGRIPKAHLIAINHNLLAVGWPGTWHQKVVDEAHTIEPVVVESTQLESSIEKLERALNRPNVGKSGPPGVPFKLPSSVTIDLVDQAKDIERAILENKIKRVRGPIEEETIARLQRLVDSIPSHCSSGISSIAGARNIKPSDIKAFFDQPGRAPDLSGIGKDAGKAMDALRNVKIFYTQANTILEFAKGPDKDSSTLVHWCEEPSPGAKNPHPILRITEADARPALKALHGNTPSIMTSATLAGPRGMTSFIESQGLTPENCRQGEYPAPFNLEEKMRIVIPKGIPEPGREEALWKAALPQKVLEAIKETAALPGGGGTLVLLTSKADMINVAEKIGATLKSHHIPLLVQDGTLERREMVEHMKTHGKTVLLGLDSFWTGIDIPGNALRHVVVCRIPFQVPTPLNEARKEIAQARGKNPFEEVDLRAAVNTMRQGIGRLIRTTSDDGLITILDPRVLTKSYGKALLARLPEASRSYEEHEPAEHQAQAYQSRGNWKDRGARSDTYQKPAWNPTRAPAPEDD